MKKTALVFLNILFACTLTGCGGDAGQNVSTPPISLPKKSSPRPAPAAAPSSMTVQPAPLNPEASGSASLPPGAGPPRLAPGAAEGVPDSTSALPGMPIGGGPPRLAPSAAPQ